MSVAGQDYNTREEFSAGGVVYRAARGAPNHKSQIPNQYEFLVGKHSGYKKWVLPKGLVEEGEEPGEAAKREVEEELGVRAEIEGESLGEIEYWFMADYGKSEGKDAKGEESERRIEKYEEGGGRKTRVHKRVRFFLMKLRKDKGKKGWEMEEKKWLSYGQAKKWLAFEGERKMLEEAKKRLGASDRT